MYESMYDDVHLLWRILQDREKRIYFSLIQMLFDIRNFFLRSIRILQKNFNIENVGKKHENRPKQTHTQIQSNCFSINQSVAEVAGPSAVLLSRLYGAPIVVAEADPSYTATVG